MRLPDQWHGILLVDKPTGMTSHDVVAHVRHIIGQKGVGHTGTLDPRATGLLILCLGRATKVVQFVTAFDKRYIADICLGRSSTTFDGEGVDLSTPFVVPNLSESAITEVLSSQTGKFKQQAPVFSAIKVKGVPLYKAARRGEDVQAPEREVEITSLKLISYEPPHIKIELNCSKGTYVRSLAHDIGQQLGCGAYLAGLRRTHVGGFSVDHACSLHDLESDMQAGRLAGRILQVENVLSYAALRVSDTFGKHVVNGRALMAPDLLGVEGEFQQGDRVVLKDTVGKILAIGTACVDADLIGSDPRKPLFSYLRVLN